MSEQESPVLDVLDAAVNSVPAPVQATLWKAFNHLLGGLTAIPAAKLNQYAQAINDTTAARSAITAGFVTQITSEGLADPVLMQAAAEILVPVAFRKAKNRLLIVQNAAKQVKEDAGLERGTETTGQLSDDWLNAFGRFSEDASSERLQQLFGRVLAGEIQMPGTYGLATLRAVSELDQTIAEDFTLAWSKNVGGEIDYSPEWQRGEGYERWQRLAEAGFMAPARAAQFPPSESFGRHQAPWSPMQYGDIAVLVKFGQALPNEWLHINFTRIGKEIGSLLEEPDYAANMREAAFRLPRLGVTSIQISSPAGVETIWQV